MSHGSGGLVRYIEYSLVSRTPIHIGGERGIRPATIDQKVLRMIRFEGGRFVEYIAIPGSSIKGVLRHTLEDIYRSTVVSSSKKQFPLDKDTAKPMILALIAAAYGLHIFYPLDVDKALRHLIDLLKGEQQIVSNDLGGSTLASFSSNSYDDALNDIDKKLANQYKEDKNLQNLVNLFRNNYRESLIFIISSIYPSMFPAICDPTSPSLSCLSDSAFLELNQDRRNTARLLLNIALGRKIPLRREVCPVCSLFGSQGRESPLRFFDAVLEDGSSSLPFRTRVQIDRMTYTAKKGKLFTMEYIPEGCVFRGRIAIVEPLARYSGLDTAEIEVLIRDLFSRSMYRMFGGFKSVGMGHVELVEMKPEGNSGGSGSGCRSIDDVAVKHLKSHIGELKGYSSSRDNVFRRIAETYIPEIDKNDKRLDVLNEIIVESYRSIMDIVNDRLKNGSGSGGRSCDG